MSSALGIGYDGRACPMCERPLPDPQNGPTLCPSCGRSFDGTVFHPVNRRSRPTEVLVATPGGVANACANHARNAAVTTCQRCGLFMCELCDMNLGEGSFCPSCFDRGRAEGTLQGAVTRYRDHASMARVTVVVGLFFSFFFLGLPLGIMAIYYANKGIRQRRSEGASIAGMVVVIIFGALEVLGSLAIIGLFIWGLTK